MTADSQTSFASRSLDDQVVLVTGGARGLGRSLSEAFLAEGARVVINYQSSHDAATELADRYGKQAVAIQADVRDRSQIEELMVRAADEFGLPVTTVVNSALVDFSFNGEARPHADAIDYTAFDQQFTGTIGGAVNTIRAALPGFERLGWGCVINIGTNLFQNPVVPYHDYTAAKAALLSLTRTYAADLGPRHIRVNMVSGGLLRTTDASAATPESVFDTIAEGTPLRSVVSPNDFAQAALFFASPWARAVTGQNLVVDGGLVKD